MSPPPTARTASRVIPALSEGQRLEAYVERQTSEMRVCALCEKVQYRRKPMKRIGARWVCIDCLRTLKESLDGLDRWEELSTLHAEMDRAVSGDPKA